MERVVDAIRRARDSDRPSGVIKGPSSALPRLEAATNFKPLLLAPYHCVREALSAFAKGESRAALVIGEDGQVLGDISETDCLRVLASGAYHRGDHEGCRQLGDVMCSEPVVVAHDADPFQVAQQMLERHREVAAVTQSRRLRGAVSSRRLLRLLAREDDPQCQDPGGHGVRGGPDPNACLQLRTSRRAANR